MTTGLPFEPERKAAMFISPFLADLESGGGLVSRTNLACLRSVLQEVKALALSRAPAQDGIELLGNPGSSLNTALCNVALLAGRLTPRSLLQIIRQVRSSQPDIVFLDSSSLGWIALLTRWLAPKTRVVSFFHNVEFDFQIARRRAEGCYYLLSAAAEYVNEWLTTRSAHALLTLTNEDAQRIYHIYARRADQLWPVCLLDNISDALPDPTSREDAVLFVGSGFFANREAVEFLLKQVAPALAKKGGTRIHIAGRGFSRSEWSGSIPDNVDMCGYMPDLTPCYRRARAFVAPIFSGTGMKVKVAEALMHGLPVIGTPLALLGYIDQSVVRNHLMEATTAEAFADAIEMCRNSPSSLYISARDDFKQRFSRAAGYLRARTLVEQLLAHPI